MTITCPACNKAGQTGAACARCACDLTRLRATAEAAARRLSLAAEKLRACDWDGALAEAEQSWRLCHTVESARLAFVGAAASAQPERALVWRRRAAGADPDRCSGLG